MMDQSWQTRIPEHLSFESKVWIYQSNRPFGEQELKEIEEQLYQFYIQWTSHNRPVKGWAGVLFNRFIVIVADDTMDRLCGSAVDYSVHLIKSLERQYRVSLLDRMLLAFLVDGSVQLLPLNQVAYAIAQGKIVQETIYFNNTVTTKAAMMQHWMIPVKNSWIGKRFPEKSAV